MEDRGRGGDSGGAPGGGGEAAQGGDPGPGPAGGVEGTGGAAEPLPGWEASAPEGPGADGPEAASSEGSGVDLGRLTRRGLLIGAAAGAAGWAAATWPRGGTDAASVAAIEGGIVGAGHALGHRVRDGGAFPPPAETRAVDVVIVGGGIAGLSAAWKLAGSGLADFVLLELEPEAGGNSRAGANAVTPYPWGAHYVPFPPAQARAVRELFRELGVIVGDRDGEPVYDERYVCFAPQERLFAHGRWQEGLYPRTGMTAEDAAEAKRFRERMAGFRAWRDPRGRPAFALPMESSTDDAEIVALDRLSMADWLDREGFRSPRLRWFVNYACRDDYGCTIGTTSAWAGIHYFCAREIEEPEVLTWPEGNGWIVRRLTERLGERVRTGMLAFRVERAGDRGSGGEGAVVDAWDARAGRTVRFEARRAIYALPRFTVPHVVRGIGAGGLEAFTYAPWMVANVTLDAAPDETAWDNVLYEGESLGWISATHQRLSVRPGPTVWTYYRPFASGDPAAVRREMLARPWSEWRDQVLADLRRPHPGIERRVRRIDVMLWGHGMIRPTPGFLTSPARLAAQEPCGPIHFAHSDLSGLSLFEEAQYRGVKAAEAVMRELGVEFRSSL